MVSEVSLHGDGTQQSYSHHGRQEAERVPGTLVILFPSQIYLGLQQRGWGVPHEWEVFLSGDTFTVTPRYVLPFSVLDSLLPTWHKLELSQREDPSGRIHACLSVSFVTCSTKRALMMLNKRRKWESQRRVCSPRRCPLENGIRWPRGEPFWWGSSFSVSYFLLAFMCPFSLGTCKFPGTRNPGWGITAAAGGLSLDNPCGCWLLGENECAKGKWW